jgi:hypothetical protein
MLRPLDLNQFVEALDSWTGRTLSVRVVSSSDELIAVLGGELGQRSDEKHPAVFWALLGLSPGGLEKPGLYLHPDRFEGAAAHPGKTVLELRQDGVTTNIRRP